MNVIIVCHTEFGEIHKGRVIATKEHDGTTAAVDRLRAIIKRHGAKLTLAVCPEVAEYVKPHDSEIGLHVHPGWEQFEFRGRTWIAGDGYMRNYYRYGDSTILRDYPLEQQLDMIAGAQFKLARVFGTTPKVFVAGRWSLNNDTVAVLDKIGITHDCSAVPGGKAGHFDWSRLPRVCSPYHPDKTDYQSSGDTALTIVPVSQMLLKGRNVSPESEWPRSLTWLKLAFWEYAMRKEPVFHVCLHSPAMLNPYFAEVLDRLLGFIADTPGVNFRFASEIVVQ